MKPSTTIRELFAGNRIFVPDYHRAYSWDTEAEISKAPEQVNSFLSDLEDHISRPTTSNYYFGHFLFQEITGSEFAIIDGHQRLASISIFLSALFTRLKSLRPLSDTEAELFEDTIKRKMNYRFATVHYDSPLFNDYVIDQIKRDVPWLERESTKKIMDAFDFLTQKLADKDEAYLVTMLDTLCSASCTTYCTTDENETVKLYVLQNCRGKIHSAQDISNRFMIAMES